MPFASHSRRTPASQPAGGMMMPASPWMGSISTATVAGVIACSSGREIAEWNAAEPRRERSEAVPVIGL